VRRLFLLLSLFLAWPLLLLAERVSFNGSVLPILADSCFQCHGPDANTRKADFRLDRKEVVLRTEDPVIVPGDVASSQLIDRINTSDPRLQMPPPNTQRRLSPAEIKTLQQWVSEGANWDKHWAFVPPIMLTPPTTLFDSNNEIDHFIQSSLSRQQLQPSPPTDKASLLRRVTMDLTGLPPTIEELDTFLAATSDNAYERVVERLLSTTAHAERLALDWMDLSRYADSHGMHADGWRQMWPWRDWVIDAFHRNLPYDEFVTWQLAGDLLEVPTQEQRLATAFHRNHPMMSEAGSIEEEFRLQNVFDRVETTATAFLGLTMNCARCHAHKFDPISQSDYYRFSAFFNNVQELGMIGNDGNFGPTLPYPNAETTSQLHSLDQRMETLSTELQRNRQLAQKQFKSVANKYMRQQRLGESSSSLHQQVSISSFQSQAFPFDVLQSVRTEAGKQEPLLDGNPEVVFKDTLTFIPGVNGQAVEIDGEHGFLTLKEVGKYDVADVFSIALWVRPQLRKDEIVTRTLLGTTGNKNQYWRGWDLFLDQKNRLSARLVHNLPDNLLHIRSTRLIADQQWTHVVVTYDGAVTADMDRSLRLFINGQACLMETVHNGLTRTILEEKARDVRVGRSYRSATGEFGIYHGALDDLRFYQSALTAVEVAQLYQSYSIAVITSLQPAAVKLTMTDWFEHWLQREHDDWQTNLADYRQLYKERIERFSQVPLVMVMREMTPSRDTYCLERGVYDQRRQMVQPGMPTVVMPFSIDLPTNRLGLSQWLFDPANPLTARVTVNRYWQMLFGQGLVRTPHDFGVQGQRPTHPQLLDWLAVWFQQSGWNVRELLKLMVTSATYQQSSKVDLASVRIDPENRWLWRFPVYRWPAEFLRDSALAGSGLLIRQVGGPSVKPYQPPGLWIEKNNFSAKLKTYQMDSGASLYRRSLYTFIRRTSPPPAMQILDAPNRSVCIVKRVVTNTPLQALVLMNDTQFVEAARGLAEGVQRQADNDLEQRLTQIFRLLTGHRPTTDEMNLLQHCHHRNRERFQQDTDAANALLQVGESPPDATLSPAETAALAVVANLIMNSDGFYMKR